MTWILIAALALACLVILGRLFYHIFAPVYDPKLHEPRGFDEWSWRDDDDDP